MDLFPVFKELAQKTPSKVLLIVLDGVGGLPLEPGGPTELEAARTPNLDRLAEESALGSSPPSTRASLPAPAPATWPSSATTPSATWWAGGR